MKKLILFLVFMLITAGTGFSQVTILWQKSAATGTLPSWDGGSLTRGLSYGLVGGQQRLFVVTRSAALGNKQIIVYNAATGDSVTKLDTTGLSGGTYALNDVEVSTNGKIFVCNLTTALNSSAFKVYRYDSLTAAPVPCIEYLGSAAERLGDKFTVTGSTADNSIIIWAASSAVDGNIYKFQTTDNGVTFSPTVINKATFGGSASVGPLPNQDFYYNYQGISPQKYTATGTLIGDIPSTVVGTGSNAIRFMRTLAGDEYFTTVAFGTNMEHGRIVKVPNGVPSSAVLYATTSTLGTNAASGLGDISVQQVSNFVFNVYVLSTNNGFGAYKVQLIPSLAGSYYIGAPGTGPGGSNPQFASLREAFDALNDAVFTGDCTFYITSDLTETYGSPFQGLGLAINPDPYTVTFKPYTGVQPVITLTYPSDGNSGPSGGMIIGIPSKGNVSWDSLRTTKNIVIDGSNTEGGTTRDLTIQTSTTAQRNAMPLVVVGDVSNLIVKNTKIYYKVQTVSTSGNLFIGAVMIRSRNYLNANWSPHNLLFENNHLSGNFSGVAQSAQGYGLYQTGTPNVLNYPYNITLKNNLIEGRRRAVALYRAGSHDIFGNEIIVDQSVAAATTNEAIYAVDVDTNAVINIYNNKISKVAGITSGGAAYGNTAISIETLGTYNIYNNMIFGFELNATNPKAYVRGIKNSSSTATLNLNFNSIYMTDLASGTDTVTYSGIYLTDGTNNVKDNIVMSAEANYTNYCIYRGGTTGTLTSNYNDYYPGTNGNVGFFNTAPAATLTAWQTASGQDANSLSVDPLFMSTTDLHFLNATTPLLGKGITVEGITTDYDGQVRDTIPEIGADEFPGLIPVQLVAFTASVQGSNVVLNWQTVTEANSSYFDVQRKSESGWTSVGNVKAAGNSTKMISYRFVDENVSGKLVYRLKQVDLNGSYIYSDEVEVNSELPGSFSLSQNYPNPFNPTTKINYSVPSDSKVTISVYSVTGELVAELVNGYVSAGNYTLDFDGSKLASGLYIYKMTAGKFTQTNKMMLLK